jgi:hypothetical protein
VLIQEIVDWSHGGVVTASNLFGRNLGSTLGAAVLGAVLNFGLTHAQGVGAVTSDQLRHILEAPTAVAGSELAIRDALEHSLHWTFLAMFAITLSTIALVAMVPAVAIGQRRPAEPVQEAPLESATAPAECEAAAE